MKTTSKAFNLESVEHNLALALEELAEVRELFYKKREIGHIETEAAFTLTARKLVKKYSDQKQELLRA